MPFMPTNTKHVINGRVMGGTMRRKVAKRTKPWLLPVEAAATAAENPTLLPPQPPEDEEDNLPPAKRSRLHAPISISTAVVDEVEQEHTLAEKVTADDTPDDIPTDPVTPAVSLLSKVTSRAPSRSWKGEEDKKLIKAVKKHGKNWVAVAAMVPGRTDQQCRSRWVQNLDPVAGKTVGRWKPEEDAKLIEAMQKHGKNWVAVATLVPGRTDLQCRTRWTHTLDTAGKTAGRWKPEEDTKLIDAVKKYGENWVAVAAMVPGQTDAQCRSRWVQNLDPVAGKIVGRWKPEEDTKLIEAVKKHGKNWVAVATLVPGRTNLQCFNRLTHTLDTAGKTAGRWKPEEDTKLIEAVKKHGNNWVAVAAMIPGRTNLQCHHRWTNTLDTAGKTVGRWKPEEDTKLIKAVQKHGKDWVAVAAMIPGRTNKQCSRRLDCMVDQANGK
jgi:S-ribosylhomocysteine lyase LuxS involved in autoinducer biosynthesis